MKLAADLACAERLDAEDPLGHIRSHFEMPRGTDGNETIYLVGNSLGAMPKRSRQYLHDELDAWATKGVRGHFEGDSGWADYHQLLTDQMAAIVGARAEEVVVMNSLTVNLHLLMVSFYRPTAKRHKILIEDHAFPSDHFAAESQIRQRGFDPATSLVTIAPRDGEVTLRPDDIIDAIRRHGDTLALVLLPGVQYYTGQVLPMPEITVAAHSVGAMVGFDLAHAAGNIICELHDWGPDFAAWCTYKYLNAGPGAVAGAFVHSRHVEDTTLPKFTGWWGTAPDKRFEMSTHFDPIPTVESWQLSNAPIHSMASLRGSLDTFDLAGGVPALRRKTEQQIAFLDLLLEERFAERIDNLTPRALDQRGCQFALRVTAPGYNGRAVFDQLEAANVECDWRHPDVIRVAPVPLYNTFVDIWRFTERLDSILGGA